MEISDIIIVQLLSSSSVKITDLLDFTGKMICSLITLVTLPFAQYKMPVVISIQWTDAELQRCQSLTIDPNRLP